MDDGCASTRACGGRREADLEGAGEFFDLVGGDMEAKRLPEASMATPAGLMSSERMAVPASVVDWARASRARIAACSREHTRWFRRGRAGANMLHRVR